MPKEALLRRSPCTLDTTWVYLCGNLWQSRYPMARSHNPTTEIGQLDPIAYFSNTNDTSLGSIRPKTDRLSALSRYLGVTIEVDLLESAGVLVFDSRAGDRHSRFK